MKALKEKRISLRSLWRRGLVILSLFALVFASCAEADSGGGGGDTGGGRVPVAIQVLSNPTVNSYEGLPVQLSGLKVMLKYSTAPDDYDIVSGDNPKLSTFPVNAFGVIGQRSGAAYASGYACDFTWLQVRDYTLLYQVGNETFPADIAVNVVPIIRSDAQIAGQYDAVAGTYNYRNSDVGNDVDNYYWAQGLQLTGPLTDTIYVDDYPNLSALTLQAHYVDGTKKDIPLTKLQDWEIRARNQDRTGPGDLFVTIGALPIPESRISLGSNYVTPTTGKRSIDAGITVTHPYSSVYIVKRDGLEVIFPSGGGLDNFFYWQFDSGTSWVDRLIAKGASLKVTYTNDTTKTFTVEEAVRMNDVWRNYAPGRAELIFPFGVSGVFATAGGNTTHAKNKNPRIMVNYRGGVTYLPVNLYTKFASLEVLPVTGDAPVPMDMRHSDNDVGPGGAALFAGKINVNAYFTSAADPDLPPASVRLTFLSYADMALAATLATSTYTTNPTAHQVDSTVTIDVPVVNQGAPYYNTVDNTGTYYGPTRTGYTGTITGLPDWTARYTMNFGVADTLPANNTNNPWNTDGWGPCANPKNNGKDTAITIYYRAPFNNTPLATAPEFEPAHWGVTSASAKSQKITVSWSNIRVK